MLSHASPRDSRPTCGIHKMQIRFPRYQVPCFKEDRLGIMYALLSFYILCLQIGLLVHVHMQAYLKDKMNCYIGAIYHIPVQSQAGIWARFTFFKGHFIEPTPSHTPPLSKKRRIKLNQETCLVQRSRGVRLGVILDSMIAWRACELMHHCESRSRPAAQALGVAALTWDWPLGWALEEVQVVGKD